MENIKEELSDTLKKIRSSIKENLVTLGYTDSNIESRINTKLVVDTNIEIFVSVDDAVKNEIEEVKSNPTS